MLTEPLKARFTDEYYSSLPESYPDENDLRRFYCRDCGWKSPSIHRRDPEGREAFVAQAMRDHLDYECNP